MKRIQISGVDLTPYLNKIKCVNKQSYNEYFQMFDKEKRKNIGLHKLLNSIFPIQSKTRELVIKYVDYDIMSYDYDEDILVQRQMSYTMTIKVNLVIDYKGSSQAYSIYLSHIPIMLENGAFLINGTKKVIVYHLCKTGGLYFNLRNNVITLNVSTTMGSLISFSLSSRNIISVVINRSKKLSLLMFLKLFDNDQINRYLRNHCPSAEHLSFAMSSEGMIKYISLYTKIFSVEITRESIVVHDARKDSNDYFMSRIANHTIKGEDLIIPSSSGLIYAFLAYDLHVKSARKIDLLFKAGTQVTQAFLKNFSFLSEGDSIKTKLLFLPDKQTLLYKSLNVFNYEEIQEDDSEEEKEDIEEVDSGLGSEEEGEEVEDTKSNYKILEYQITQVLRDRLNNQLPIRYSREQLHLTEEDLILCALYIISPQAAQHASQNLYNTMIYKKIKKPEEFIENVISSHLNRVKKNISIRNNFYANFQGKFYDIINYYSISTDIKKIFNVGNAIQYLDQTNLLSEISHLRRVSAIYSSITDRFRIPSAERGINPTQYGRVCPSETPEGHSIGVISSIACTALINDDGMLIVPYFKVHRDEEGNVTFIDTETLHYLTAEEELEYKIASFADMHSDAKDVLCRYMNNLVNFDRSEVDFYEILPYQMLSYASALITFIQNTDNRRALMSASMQKQAVLLTNAHRPIVGTGVEELIVKNFVPSALNKNRCRILYSDAKYILSSGLQKSDAIVLKCLTKFTKTNMKTCFHENSIVKTDDIVEENKALFHSSSIKDNELTLGNNVLVAFLSWHGYNFEDSIVISERIRRDSEFESIYINDLVIKTRDLEDGVNEQFSATAPCIDPERHTYLDSNGIVKEGTYLSSGMIAAGRVIPLQSSEVGAEESILSIIFSKKIPNIRDISYRVPYNEEGCVINVVYYSSLNTQKSTLFSSIQVRIDKITYLYKKAFIKKISYYYPCELKPRVCTLEDIEKFTMNLNDSELIASFEQTRAALDREIKKLKYFLTENRRINMDSNVSEFVSFMLVQKRCIQVGDKATGRFGNKGVNSIIVPMEDMPFLDDGTPIDMLLSPLGIPNRLNIGQIFEMHLGAISYVISKKVKFAVRTKNHEEAKAIIRSHLAPLYKDNTELSEPSDEEINEAIDYIAQGNYLLFSSPAMCNLSYERLNAMLAELKDMEDGKMRVRCGISGEYYNRKICVGLKYMLKLNHMAQDKKSVRETGTYSKVSQQPLPGKANYGGQRAGEMETWAIESYGAAFVLHEIITVKSDDIRGRIELYSNILKNRHNLKAYIPETVNVIASCIRAAGLKFEFLSDSEQDSVSYSRNKFSRRTQVKIQVNRGDSSRKNNEQEDNN